MIPGKHSRTAEYNALFRALETQEDGDRRLVDDPLAADFLTWPLSLVRAAARFPLVGRAVPALIDRRWPGPRLSGVVRTRLVDDAIVEAVGQGIEQLVILGAGYDSRAHRLPALAGIPVVEVDHPDTQREKRAVVRRAAGVRADDVAYVSMDLSRHGLARAVEDAGFRPGARTFLLCEGVISYLDPEAAERLLTWCGEAVGAGSRLALTYVHRGVLDGSTSFHDPGPWTRSVDAVGEPFVLGFEPTEIAENLRRRGWDVTGDQSTRDAAAHLGYDVRDVPGFYRLVLAEHR